MYDFIDAGKYAHSPTSNLFLWFIVKIMESATESRYNTPLSFFQLSLEKTMFLHGDKKVENN